MKEITKESFRAFRHQRNMSQAQMAEYMGVSIQTIQSWEQDTSKRNVPKRLLSDPRTKHLGREVD